MMRYKKTYYVYIVASASRVIYIGFTSTLKKRVWQHRNKTFKGFSAQYNCHRLVFFEGYGDVGNAIHREKELKGWRREKKVALIEEDNRDWHDLSEGWYQDPPVIKYY